MAETPPLIRTIKNIKKQEETNRGNQVGEPRAKAGTT
jgi:hypothetical protein